MENLSLIVGLGNPGRNYVRTRHNAGYMLVERLAERRGAVWHLEGRFKARIAKAEYPGGRVLLCQPQTFMNASGEAAGPLAAFYRVPPARMLVVVDDADLPLGHIRLRPKGGTGGHRGLESIERHLGTQEYPRLRIGIGRRADGARQITNYVLDDFAASESGLVEKVLTRAADQVECWVTSGIEKAMSQFNGAVEAAA
jgi:peptidyl-tRNA hydrolase, PTH1 family